MTSREFKLKSFVKQRRTQEKAKKMSLFVNYYMDTEIIREKVKLITPNLAKFHSGEIALIK